MTRAEEREAPLVAVSIGTVHKVPPRDFLIRFAFGAGISASSGIIGILLGVRIGGLFLAFPAILPAALTLIEKEESEHAAEDDAVGAVLGALALGAFAVLGWKLLPHLGPVALAIAAGGWLVCAVALYLLLRLPFR